MPADMAVDLPPLNLTLAQALIRRSRTGALLGRPLRDRPAARIDAVAETLVRISQLIVDFPEIAALDVPSLFVDPDGVLVADAWLRLRRRRAAGQCWRSRPTRGTDRARRRRRRAHDHPPDPAGGRRSRTRAFFARLSPEDIRYRFFTAMRELSAEQMARLTQVDYDREMAFVAIREATGETVGVARLVCEAGRTSR